MTSIRNRISKARQAGFTLIELLIVIVILGILAGIAIFAVGQFQNDATTACSKANNRINQTISAANQIASGHSTAGTSTC